MIEYYKISRTNKCIVITISNDNINIHCSYDVTSIKDMKEVIKHVYYKYICKADNHNRTMFNLLNEWRAHNLLYTLGLFRSHTKDVDLNYNQHFIMKVLYGIASLFYFHYK